LTRRLVELHGGHIWIESEGVEGKGSTFTFTLPLGMKVPEPAGAPPGTPQNPPMSPSRAHSHRTPSDHPDDRRPTVLVVEDNRQASDLLNHYLTEAGYAVTHAYDGQEAIRIARELQPDAVTLDILLPREDGWHVLADLKSSPETARIPVVIVSITEDHQLAFSLGAVEYLIKPVSKRQLIDALNKATAAQTSEDKTVLLVDDDPHVIELLGGMLRPLGYRVLAASGGAEGIERAIKEKPQAIVLDLMMPHVTGFDVVNALCAHSETRDIPIIIFSAKDITEEDRRRLNNSIRGIVSKSGKEALLEELEKLNIGSENA
jgi:CheY-like chemotaxis protein